MKNPYEVLGIDPSASNESLKARYKELARKYHPDNYSSNDPSLSDYAEEKMKEINEAYDEILRLRAKRANEKSSSDENSSFSKVRSAIAEGDFDGAEIMLNTVKAEDRNAEWNFLKACIMTQRGYYFDALKYVNIACDMNPENNEYRDLKEILMRRSGKYGYQQQGQGSQMGCNMCDICSCLICLDCLCR